MSKKQYIMSTSITEAKYIALEHDAWQKVWMWRFINKSKLDDTITNITLLNDNKSNIKLMHNTKQHNLTKHINVQHHVMIKILSEYITENHDLKYVKTV